MSSKRAITSLKDWRVITLAAACGAVGFVVAMLIFGMPWHLPPAWGDIPSWIAAIATIGLLIGAIITAKYAIKAFGEQSREVRLLVEESNRQATDRRKAQAAQVFTGSPQPEGLGTGTVPYVRNTSDLPIYDAQIWYPQYQGLSGPDDLGVILPGEEISASGNMIASDRETALSSIILTFRDAAGFRWIRMPDGAINEQSHSTAHESVLAALEHNLPTHYERLGDQITGSVVDAIMVYPQSHGELHLPGEFSMDLGLRRTGNSPPAREVTVTSEDGSTQGVYTESRSIGPVERYTLVWDVWNHRDSRVFASMRLTGPADQGQADTPGG